MEKVQEGHGQGEEEGGEGGEEENGPVVGGDDIRRGRKDWWGTD